MSTNWVFGIDNKFESARITEKVLSDVVKNIEYNETIQNYYLRMSHESTGVAFSSDMLIKKKEKVKFCNMLWRFDTYHNHRIKDFKSTSLCKDKFCANCKKVRQSARMAKYIPELGQFGDRLYHMVLTLPNCHGSELMNTIKHMSKCFKQLIRYLDGRDNIMGLDFESFGYKGAVRSLEITFKGDSYHPHYHVALVLEHNLDKKIIENKYSYNFLKGIPELTRLFSEKEILIQKVWYLLLNKKTVSKFNIDNLTEGYSCMIDMFKEHDYAELFKYMTKETDESGQALAYDNFVSLFYGTYRIKQIQGYGCLYNITDDGDLDSYEKQYEDYIKELRQKEMPVDTLERPRDILRNKDYTFISRKSYFNYLRQL